MIVHTGQNQMQALAACQILMQIWTRLPHFLIEVTVEAAAAVVTAVAAVAAAVAAVTAAAVAVLTAVVTVTAATENVVNSKVPLRWSEDS